MNNEQLLPEESVLFFTENGMVTLTTHRIRYNNKIWGQSNFISIMLEKISSVQVLSISYPLLWILGVLIGVIGLLMATSHNDGTPEVVVSLFIAFFLIVGYLSRAGMSARSHRTAAVRLFSVRKICQQPR
ncbi:hypothetical protein ACVW0P_001824 [Mucilaginibacter sp. UYNi724]